MTPSKKIIEKAISQVKNGFTTEVLACSKINKTTFVVSVVNVRGGQKHLFDYTFTTNTGRMTNTKLIESKLL